VEPEPQPEVGDAAYTGQGTVAVVLYKYEVTSGNQSCLNRLGIIYIEQIRLGRFYMSH
jgi:hypothetical protein